MSERIGYNALTAAFNPKEAKEMIKERTKRAVATRKKNRENGVLRKDAEINRDKIREAFIEHYEETGKIPTNKVIAEKVGLTEMTVGTYINSLKFDEYFVGLQKKMIHMCDQMITSLVKKGDKGDVAAIKLFFQLLGWSEKTEIKEQKKFEFNITKTFINSPEEFKKIKTEDADYQVVAQQLIEQ